MAKRVLVVDDNDQLRALVCEVFEDEGFDTISARDGAAAVDLVLTRPPDIVLLDLEMPGIDGWGFLERLHRISHPPPVVILSAGLGYKSFARSVKAGAVAFLPKPIHFPKLLSTCRRALAKASGEPLPPELGAERRKDERRGLMIGVNVIAEQLQEGHEHRQEVREPPTVVLGELTDLSASGAQVILVSAFQIGTQLQVQLDPFISTKPLRFDGVVRWLTPRSDGFAHGLNFVDLASEVQAQISDLLG